MLTHVPFLCLGTHKDYGSQPLLYLVWNPVSEPWVDVSKNDRHQCHAPPSPVLMTGSEVLQGQSCNMGGAWTPESLLKESCRNYTELQYEQGIKVG